MSENQSLSIIIPAFNEQNVIGQVIRDLLNFLNSNRLQAEIIVVNDGSKDRTGQILEQFRDQIKVIHHPYNKGYGAALKTGMRAARHDWILWLDGDGQHIPSEINKLLPYINQYDMIVGQRQSYQGPLIRRPGKKLLQIIANYLTGRKIPDLNSGFRLFKKKLALQFMSIYPNAFSITTTITLAFLREGFSVKYVPFELNKRKVGKSTVGYFKDGLRTILLIFRIIMLFSPLKIFLPASFILFLGGTVFLINDLIHFDIGDTSVLLLISSFLLFFFGLLADQLAAIRRSIRD
jgi:glycosyltransferase involved in cell wall biosynthesis